MNINNLINEGKLYFINRKISKLEREKTQILSQRKVDISLQSLLVVGYFVGDISKRLSPLYESKNRLTTKLNYSPTGESIQK